MPKRVYVSLKGEHGLVDLTFERTVAYLLQPPIVPLLEAGMSVQQTGASAAVRLEVPRFKVDEGRDVALPKLRMALEAAARLARFYRRNRDILDNAARQAAPAR